jgi:hypothetical protein
MRKKKYRLPSFQLSRKKKETNVLSSTVGFYTVQSIFNVVGEVLQELFFFCHSEPISHSLCGSAFSPPPSMNYVGGDTNERQGTSQKNRIERQTDRDMG